MQMSIFLDRYIIWLIYIDKTFNNVTGLVGDFVKKFWIKLMSAFDNLTLLVEWGVPAILDPH